jgi:hypothetical protein
MVVMVVTTDSTVRLALLGEPRERVVAALHRVVPKGPRAQRAALDEACGSYAP